MSDEIRFLGDMRKLTLKPGDVLVLTCEDHLSDHVMRLLRKNLEEKFPGYTCLVLCGGLKLGIVEKAAA